MDMIAASLFVKIDRKRTSERPLRVVHYTRPSFIDHSLPLVRALAKRASVHLVLELSPEERVAGFFGERDLLLEEGIWPATVLLDQGYLAGARSFIQDLASFDVVAHSSPRAFAPAAIKLSARAAAHVAHLRPDVVHFEDVSSRSAPIHFLMLRTPTVVAIHDAHAFVGEPSGRRAALIRRITLTRSDQLLFYSNSEAGTFQGDGRRRAPVRVPLGPKLVQAEWPGPNVPEHGTTVLFFGRIQRFKGLEVLYAALPEVAERVSGLRVIVAGPPGYSLPPPPKLTGSAEVITRFDSIQPAEARQLFQQAAVVVLPYIDSSQSGVVQTAYAFYKPVVASAVGGLAEAVVDGVTGRLVPPGDAHALALTVTELLLDQGLRVGLSRGIRRLEAEQFGWDRITERLHHVYSSLLTQSG
jgi:glycosyltransferase involved in cell wall biosynthesis